MSELKRSFAFSTASSRSIHLRTLRIFKVCICSSAIIQAILNYAPTVKNKLFDFIAVVLTSVVLKMCARFFASTWAVKIQNRVALNQLKRLEAIFQNAATIPND